MKAYIKNINSRKIIIAILVIVSLVMSSSTFAYWAGHVNGTETSYTSSFKVGLPIEDEHEFLLDSNVSQYKVKIDLDYLLENPDANIDEIIFGVIWNDEKLSDETKEKLLNGTLKIDYDLNIYRNNREVNKKTYKKYAKLVNIELHDFEEDIHYNDPARTIQIDVSLNEQNNSNDYRKLAKYDLELEIKFKIK